MTKGTICEVDGVEYTVGWDTTIKRTGEVKKWNVDPSQRTTVGLLLKGLYGKWGPRTPGAFVEEVLCALQNKEAKLEPLGGNVREEGDVIVGNCNRCGGEIRTAKPPPGYAKRVLCPHHETDGCFRWSEIPTA
jgi:hypothetical protein